MKTLFRQKFFWPGTKMEMDSLPGQMEIMAYVEQAESF